MEEEKEGGREEECMDGRCTHPHEQRMSVWMDGKMVNG